LGFAGLNVSSAIEREKVAQRMLAAGVGGVARMVAGTGRTGSPAICARASPAITTRLETVKSVGYKARIRIKRVELYPVCSFQS
jgi:hypothetical protein